MKDQPVIGELSMEYSQHYATMEDSKYDDCLPTQEVNEAVIRISEIEEEVNDKFGEIILNNLKQFSALYYKWSEEDSNTIEARKNLKVIDRLSDKYGFQEGY